MNSALSQKLFVATICIVLLIAFVGVSKGNQLLEKQKGASKDADLYDKIHGSLYGKCIGLVLGQPVEGWSKQEIEKKARAVQAYPISYYFPANFDAYHKGFLLGNFDRFPPNDDTTLMTVSFLALKEYGTALTSRKIAEMWVKCIDTACTAEDIALKNFKKGIWPPESAIIDNPYREWIGAQMRAEIWGMIVPGLPEAASSYAEKDAVISHIDNGVYGAQYVAAMVSLAMVNNNVEEVVTKALAVIPEHSEYGRAIKDVISCYRGGDDWQKAWQFVDDHYGWNSDGTRIGKFVRPVRKAGEKLYQKGENWRWVHSVPNGAVCALALLYGKGDFSRSICLATMCGFDADCNAGTVGAVLGAMSGQEAIPKRWKAPLNDRFMTGIVRNGPSEIKISQFAREITDLAEGVLKEH